MVRTYTVQTFDNWTYTVKPSDSWTYTVLTKNCYSLILLPLDSWTKTVQSLDSCMFNVKTSIYERYTVQASDPWTKHCLTIFNCKYFEIFCRITKFVWLKAFFPGAPLAALATFRTPGHALPKFVYTTRLRRLTWWDVCHSRGVYQYKWWSWHLVGLLPQERLSSALT